MWKSSYFLERRESFMSKWLWSACATAFILGSGWGESSILAQPPGPPVDAVADFDDVETSGGITLSFDIFTGKLSLSFSLPWNFLHSRLPEGVSTPNAPEPTGRPKATYSPRAALLENGSDRVALQAAQARAMFEIAERCLKNGDLDKARTCYEETHLLAPETRYGRDAIQRLSAIDSARTSEVSGGAEEQELRGPTARPRD
jgi:hypothetical protein